MLKGAPCSAKLQREYLSFYVGHIIPHLGPTPAQFKLLSQSNPPIYPCSYFSDDHTPMEANIVLEDNGNLVMQFAMEPLSADGSPAPLEECIRLLESLKNVDCIKQLDMTWNDICRQNLAYKPGSEADRSPSHFFLGRLDFIFGLRCLITSYRVQAWVVGNDYENLLPSRTSGVPRTLFGHRPGHQMHE